MDFTAEQKLKAVRREIAKREGVYPRLVDRRLMTPEQMRYEIDVMRAIATDYSKEAAKDRLL